MEKHGACIFRKKINSFTMHGVTFQKTVIFRLD
jgi:hypothetical protein